MKETTTETITQFQRQEGWTTWALHWAKRSESTAESIGMFAIYTGQSLEESYHKCFDNGSPHFHDKNNKFKSQEH